MIKYDLIWMSIMREKVSRTNCEKDYFNHFKLAETRVICQHLMSVTLNFPFASHKQNNKNFNLTTFNFHFLSIIQSTRFKPLLSLKKRHLRKKSQLEKSEKHKKAAITRQIMSLQLWREHCSTTTSTCRGLQVH
jgi:hypothetical protein